MNCILYLLDGLSPLAIKNSTNNKFLGAKIRNNYLSNLQKKSINLSNVYGYGETFSTTYELFTNKDIYRSFCDAFNLYGSFTKNNNLAYYFKKNNFNTFLYRDTSRIQPMSGFYGRYFNVVKDNFDFFCLKKKTESYSFKNFFYENKINNFLKEKENNFFVFHDHSLHDNKKAYMHPTASSYLEAVDSSSKVIKSNLDLIKYNKKVDTLILLSDHGLNISPYDKMHFKKKISVKEYNNYYPHLFIDEKLKMTCFIKYPGVKKKNVKNFYKPGFIYTLIKEFAKKNTNKKNIATLIERLLIKKSNKIIVSARAATQDCYNNFFLRDYFHCHFLLLSKNKKISYSHNHENLFYDFKNKKNISFYKAGNEFTDFLSKYFSLKNYLIKSYLFIFSITLRITLFILKKIRFESLLYQLFPGLDRLGVHGKNKLKH